MSTHQPIRLIAGLGNPGDKYAKTRHNVGFWFLSSLQNRYLFSLNNEKKFQAHVGSFLNHGHTIRVVAPMTFMNLSGNAVAGIANFYQIPAEQILIVHDEIDLDAGVNRLKFGGGHGGHNGLRDIIPKIGSKDFLRLRIGVGHPGNSKAVSNYVLSTPSKNEQIEIERAIETSLDFVELLLLGEVSQAMKAQNTKACA